MKQVFVLHAKKEVSREGAKTRSILSYYPQIYVDDFFNRCRPKARQIMLLNTNKKRHSALAAESM